MAKKKKISKFQQALDTLAADLGILARKFETLQSETRYALAASRDVVSAQTDRTAKLNSRLEQVVGQTNGGFQNVKSDMQRASQALNAHERDIANLQTRVYTLEAPKPVVKKGKR